MIDWRDLARRITVALSLKDSRIVSVQRWVFIFASEIGLKFYSE